MSKPDTSREAVELRAQQHDGTSAIFPGFLGAWCRETADLLRALVDERDYWMQNSATAWDTCEQRRLQAAQASLERDALMEALHSVYAFINREYHDPEAAAEGEYVTREARPIWAKICAAIAKAKGGDQ